MKAKIKTRIGANHVPLQNVIPLETPYLIFLDPSNICNFKCKFCPTGDRKLAKKFRKPALLQLDDAKRIIDDLSQFPDPIKTLRLYKDGEPLLNQELPEIIRYAKSTGRFQHIDTTTNGSLLTEELSNKLAESGLSKIFISIEGLNERAYQDFSGYKINLPSFLANIEYLYHVSRGKMEIHIKMTENNPGIDRHVFFYDMYGDICDYISIEHTAPCWPGFDVPSVDQNLDIYGYSLPAEAVKVCPYIFYSLTINSIGSVSICFLDWKHQGLLGWYIGEETSIQDIWNGKQLKSFRRRMLEGKRDQIGLCKNCEQLRYGRPDNIDAYAKELLEKI